MDAGKSQFARNDPTGPPARALFRVADHAAHAAAAKGSGA